MPKSGRPGSDFFHRNGQSDTIEVHVRRFKNMKKAALIFGLFFSLVLSAAAQVRTVTNSTLQKFQQKRIAAERDYRENYEKLGFPSPEELDRQREADLKARIEIAEQLRQARLEK